MHVGNARLKIHRFSAARAGTSCGLALLAFLFGSKALQNAVAEGDTRTISLHHIHTDEDITITFKRDGRYDEAALEKLNWFLRDWRRAEQTRMDPHLIDLIWEVEREADAKEPIQVVCGYRSPQTNAMLRHRSAHSGVARFSQHMLGHAMDFYIPGVRLEQVREYGLRLQRGGVGFYPESGSPFVHMDTGGVRMWPRMSRVELARVFPDGRTVLIPSDGKPMPGYAVALADIRKRGGAPSDSSLIAARDNGVAVETMLASNVAPRANPFAKLLGLAKDDGDEDADESVAASTNAAPAAPKHPVLAALARDAKVAEQATAKAAIKVADAASKVKLIRTAEAKSVAEARPAVESKFVAQPLAPAKPAPQAKSTNAPPTPSQVIAARGYWEGPQDGSVAPLRAANALANAPQPRRLEVASNDPDVTGTLGPLAAAGANDRVAPDLAFAYAAQPDRDAGIAALRAAATQTSQTAGIQPAAAQPVSAQSARPVSSNGTTVAVKHSAAPPTSAIVKRGPGSMSVVRAGVRFENPWLRAVVLSPSVRRYLTTMALGTPDYRTLAALMVKPSSAVMMTFAADPNPGLATDHFSGAAIVFVSTVSYPTRTASLR